MDNAQYLLSPEDLEMESIVKATEEMGLSKTPINERYFSQPDMLDKAGMKRQNEQVRKPIALESIGEIM